MIAVQAVQVLAIGVAVVLAVCALYLVATIIRDIRRGP